MAQENTSTGTPAPHPVPHALGGGHAAPPVPPAEPSPSAWGRVDEEGTVYVTTADGERAVGVWQAGSPDEGLLHYARRFDDLRTEVELLETRLESGAGDPKHALATATQLRDGLAEAAVVGDIAALSGRIEQVIAHAEKALASAKQEREEARAAAVVRKQALADEAEKLAAESTQWKAAGDRLRAILDEWKTVKGVDRKTDDELWKRFSKAREAFNRRRGSHFAELDKQRAGAKNRKEELIAEAEAISESSDWGDTAGRYKDLMTEWKAAGRAPKDSDEALWQRFRAAQDKFFARRSSVFSERDAEFAANAQQKEELLVEAEKIDPAANLDAAKQHLRKIQEQWDEIGKVPRERIRELDGRLKTVQDGIKSAEDSKWRRTDPEAQARAAQFRERVEQFESQAEKARAAGDERRAKKADEQAAQWREWLEAAEAAIADR
ncbi:DUF349 domain-containing protein [Amycolatopsis alba]|uniref:DUF349 domain-containing protein n=1 Tax=Amycolatopsis alba DSM 44262 TaxID=1125972 RepID=A0A229RCJ1_AMYAL|nr:DUF349 domain-containing protein [Amycolatopsis alba]OXM44390.1 DUF349 domain-containing protein [Amycolatopsis alba DSM 44262]